MQKKLSIAVTAALLLSLLPNSLNAQTTNNLKLWLKPEGITNAVASTPISFWTDTSGNGNNGFCNISANQPTYITNALNGYPVVRFTDDGSSSTANPNLRWIQSPLTFNTATTPYTAIVVYQSQVVGQRDTLIHQINGYPILYVQSNTPAGPTNLTCNAEAALISNSVPYVAGTWEIAAAVVDSATVKLYKNGVLVGSAPIGAITGTGVGNWVIGAQASLKGNGLKGDIAEVMVYNSALSGTDLTATESYLANKYNLSQVVLSDNYNTVADPAGLNDDLSLRQLGNVAPIAYISGGGPVNISGGKINLDNSLPSGGYDFFYATPYFNVLPYETGAKLQISFDILNFNAACINNPNDSWASFTLSQYLTPGGPVTDWGMLIRTNGIGAVFGSPGGSISVTPTNNYHVDMTITNGIVHLWINGADQGTSTILCPLTYEQSYMSFGLGSANNGADSANFDNLIVTRLATPPPALPATLKLADNFNTADSSDINANLARQTGPNAPVSWNTNGNANTVLSITGNALLMSNTPAGVPHNGMASPSVDFRQFEHLNSFRLKFTVAGTNDATSNDLWVGARFRDSSPARFVADADGGGTAINFFPGDGRWYLWQSFLGAPNTSAVVVSGTAAVAASYTFEFEVHTNVMRLTINGMPQALGCGDGTYLLPATQTANYVTLQDFASTAPTAAYAQFDNFSFESLDPGFSIPSPTIINPAYAGSAFSLSLNSSNTIFYAVDAKSDLTAATWNYLGGVVGNGGVVSYTNSPATNNPEFYRLRVP